MKNAHTLINIITLLIGCGIFGVIGMALGDLGRKKNGKTGFLLGFLLGPIGLLITPFLPAECQAQTAGEKSNVKPLLITAGVVALVIVGALVWIY